MIVENIIFNSFTSWIKGVFELASSNDYSPTFMSAFAVLGVTAADSMVTDETFGTTRMVIFLVLVTVLLNTIYGIRKSLMQEKILFARALKHPYDSAQYNRLLRRSLHYKFDMKRVYFVFFKCFTFLGYLFFAQQLLAGDGTFLDFGAEALAKVPVAFFWYYEFKSFGENSTVVYGKKATIFIIVEMLFEPKLGKIFGRNTPTDGVHEEELKPEDYGIKDHFDDKYKGDEEDTDLPTTNRN